MRLAVDVCIGKRGRRVLEEAGHVVVVVAEPGEPDTRWFARARIAAAEVIIAVDRDLEILCYDNRVAFLRAKSSLSGKANARRAVDILTRRGARFVAQIDAKTANRRRGVQP